MVYVATSYFTSLILGMLLEVRRAGFVGVSLIWWLRGKEPACRCRRHKRCRFNPWVRKIPWRRKWQPTPVFLPGKPLFRGAWWAPAHGVAESDTTEWLSTHPGACAAAQGPRLRSF